MKCVKCKKQKPKDKFYLNDRKCKECRKAMVRENREKNIEYYREFERQRARLPHRVAARRAYAQTEAGKEAGRKAKKRYISQNPNKRAAHVILGNAIRDGKIIKSQKCEDCGSTKKIHGHHDDYAKPLEVRWLCSVCHNQWHKENGEAKNG